MYREISINGFRGFADFHMRDLGRVNLLVGTNNCGKSTILEAVELLCSFANPRAIWSITSRRGERFEFENSRKFKSESDISHLFHGHGIEVGSRFDIFSTNEKGQKDAFRLVILQQKELGEKQQTLFEMEDEIVGPLAFQMQWKSANRGIKGYSSVLTPRGGLTFDDVSFVVDRRLEIVPIRHITARTMSAMHLARLFDEIVLTPEEGVLIDALRTIEPSIEQVGRRGRADFALRCKGRSEPIPIGTMGDGIWRMLGIAIALVTAKDGFLLVDEIDTGLHYSVMEDMWRLVERTAERLNVQVFATTHSRDCYESLAAIARESVTEESQVTIQRIEKEKAETVSFNERDIVIAAERGIEVR